MLGKILRKQQIPIWILQRNSWPFTNILLCFLAPALLTAQIANCLFSLLLQILCRALARHDSPRRFCCAMGPEHCNISTFRIPLDFSNSYFKQLLPPHPTNKGITLCVYLFLFSSCISDWIWAFLKASLPPSGRFQTAEIFRATPRWGYCPQVAALGLQIQFSEHKKLKLSTDYLLISSPFMYPLILHTYISGLGWHTAVIILKPLTPSHPFSTLQ